MPKNTMQRFIGCSRGNFALFFALSTVPIFGAAGLAVDYSRALNARSYIQTMADDAALNGAHDGATSDPARYVAFVKSSIESKYGAADWIDHLQVKSDWESATDFKVTIDGDVPLKILSALPGFPDSVPVSASSVVRLGEPKYVYSAPKVSELDPSADDYNQISVYCFDPDKRDNPGNHGRTKMRVIADNAGNSYKYKMPKCDANQYLSFELFNVRGARTVKHPEKQPQSNQYRYFTDTVITDGVEHYSLDHPMVETVLCDTFEECKYRSEGGILPEGADRTPEQNHAACEPGKYLYYGWEDRPPDAGWSDRDYNDIRIIMACPSTEQVGDRTVRLIR